MHSPFYLMVGYTPTSATLYKKIAPKPSEITFDDASPQDREKGRLDVIRQVQKNLKLRQTYKKLVYDKKTKA